MANGDVVRYEQEKTLDVVCGKIIGSGAAINVPLGFAPRVVEIINVTNPSKHNWHSGMGDGYDLQETNGAMSLVTSAGISAYAGSASAAPGFTIGTNSVLNTAADVLYFKAFR